MLFRIVYLGYALRFVHNRSDKCAIAEYKNQCVAPLPKRDLFCKYHLICSLILTNRITLKRGCYHLCSGGIIRMHLPSAMFQNVLDVLRNEKPVYIYFAQKRGFLSTSKVPVMKVNMKYSKVDRDTADPMPEFWFNGVTH